MCLRKVYQRSKINEETVSPVVQDSKKQHLQKLRKQKRKAIQEYKKREVSTPVCNNVKIPTSEVYAPIYKDILTVATEKHRDMICAFYNLLEKFQQTKTYRILFHTTQPAHMLMIVAVTSTFMIINQAKNKTDIPRSPMMSLIYLSAFMMHFGAQMWMTFVSGLSLYFSIPRHTFGEVQQVLFPRYFGLNSFLSLVTLVIFVKLHPLCTWDTHLTIQVGAMIICFLLELLIRLYLAPPLLSLIAAKLAMEKAAGVGMEVGRHDPGPLAKCPHYVKIHKAFRKVHMTIAIGNLMSIACTIVHVLYLANKICVL
ncbi:hypothetical protein L9F63_003867 [Diploptera punctata]|uniref:TMEM205-like domain-containing protein n=2 Tax=Diploptera punctata TaxID=6984 RepID=A0AAD7ZL03_DIPPU|nr:hypothetical protein L9F63_003867 [Diploptera punctata]